MTRPQIVRASMVYAAQLDYPASVNANFPGIKE
jgi:hypothetical protein